MLKFLLILLIVFIAIIIGLRIVFKKFISSFLGANREQGGSFRQNPNEEAERRKRDDIIYDKDNVVVLKGEAGKNRKDPK